MTSSEVISLIMGGYIILLSAGLLLYVRGERKNSQVFMRDVLASMVAKSAEDAAKAKALELYQAEAIREQRIAFDDAQAETKLQRKNAVARDAHGREYEVLAGDDYATT